MTIQEMREAAQKAIDAGQRSIVFKLKRPPGNVSETPRLLGASGPRGELLHDTGNRLVVSFNPVEIIAWLG